MAITRGHCVSRKVGVISTNQPYRNAQIALAMQWYIAQLMYVPFGVLYKATHMH